MDRNVPIRWGFIGCGQATELKMLPAFTEVADAGEGGASQPESQNQSVKNRFHIYFGIWQRV